MAENTSNASEQVKMIPESDLLTVKKGAEESIQKLTGEFASKENTYKSELSKTQEELTKARAQITELDGKAKLYSATSEALLKTTAERDAALTSGKTISDKYLSHRINYFTQGYGIPEDKVAGKTHEQLDTFEEALAALGKTPNFNRMDSTTPPAGTKLTPLEQAKLELKRAEVAGTGKPAE